MNYGQHVGSCPKVWEDLIQRVGKLPSGVASLVIVQSVYVRAGKV